MFEENTINNLKLLVKASRMEGMKAELLFDPYGVKMFLKEKKGTKAFYRCSSNKTKFCMVRLTLNLETDEIERLDGIHNHDSDLVAETVKKIINDKMDSVADNPTVSPRSVMTDITAMLGCLMILLLPLVSPASPSTTPSARWCSARGRLSLTVPPCPRSGMR